LEVIVISRISLPHTPIRRTRRNRFIRQIPQFIFERTPKAFTPSTPLPALALVKRNGTSYLARVDKTNDFNGHLFARVTFSGEQPQWTNAVNIIEVV
jgi:hypothetical protein